jgi:hypothetical protein
MWVVSYVGISRVSYQTIGDTGTSEEERPSQHRRSQLGQPLGQIGHGAASSGQRYHEVMMCGGGGGKIGGRGAGGDDSSMMQIFASIDHGGRRHRTAAMGPHSRQKSIQQSTNILFERATSLKLEKTIVITIFMTIFGTMHRRTVVPDVCRFRWSYRLDRAFAAKVEGHMHGICPPSRPVCLDWHIGHGWGLGR